MLRRGVVSLSLVVVGAFISQVHPSSQTPAFDLVIRGGRIVDGTGNPWLFADVGIKGDSIAAVATHIDASDGRSIIDASGLVVAPGFIDVHSHSESRATGRAAIDDGQDLDRDPSAENNVRQGVTTVFANPDGGGSVDVAAYLARVTAAKPAINVGAFVGHGSVRGRVIGQVNRPASPEELQQMRYFVRQAMRDGAFGLSTGLFYVPGNYAPLSEVIALATVAGQFGGIHQSHMRDEAVYVVDSVRETIRIGEEGHLPTQVTHHKTMGKVNWGKSVDTLRLIDEARARGVDVTMD